VKQSSYLAVSQKNIDLPPNIDVIIVRCRALQVFVSSFYVLLFLKLEQGKRNNGAKLGFFWGKQKKLKLFCNFAKHFAKNYCHY